MISDIGHSAYAVYDMDRALEFYEKLGIRESFRLHHDDGSLMLVYLHVSGDRFIELFPNGPAPGSGRQSSYRHLCLLSPDVQATVEELRRRGVTIDREPAMGLDGNWQAWISDPDGNPVELMQISPDSPQARAASAGAE